MAARLAAAQPERSLAAPACGGPHRPAASAAARQAPQADTRAAAVPGGSAGGAACVPCTWKREGVGKAAHQKAGAAACLAAMRSKGAAGLGQEAADTAWGCCAWAVAQPKQQQAGAGSREGERAGGANGCGCLAAAWAPLAGGACLVLRLPFCLWRQGRGKGAQREEGQRERRKVGKRRRGNTARGGSGRKCNRLPALARCWAGPERLLLLAPPFPTTHTPPAH